ncbi:NAD(P)/FAD-dependent oxidoreductase [Nocardioides zeae]|uniref:NAD(P)/FAD-dependent oxidoreductase n=1 Tax=Nocardioides imazamoxiresistens TaxID=3231893 RepID=A0ABU3PSD8_9ACTN|nr:NAD(P)/FAD-dependent oxidoreductase [Nocardioides zeae]MDT9592143.1 NAD(P)/FAD-dependent oxidoreductase [Nocardioides zeae]
MPDATPTPTDASPDASPTRVDALVVGAGISGIHQLWELRGKGLRTVLLEAGSGVGGVWFWNRYPGARFDSESYTYGYFFSPEILEEWTWSEEYAGQPETERYLNFVADRLDLRKDMRFDARVVSAHWQEDERVWEVTTATGEVYLTTYLVTALGILSKPAFPRVPGLEDFQGEWHHTGTWPVADVDVRGKRVAVIGTGSSGVQVIPFLAKDAASLTVFQRTANWATPINNFAIDDARAADLRERIQEIYTRTQETPGGAIHAPMTESSLALSDEERRAVWDRLYDAPGMAFVLGNFRDVALSREANGHLTAYLTERIRERVKDPRTAALLTPDDHGFGQKRPPLENGYYEVFNEPHVRLVSTVEDPLVRYTPTGLETAIESHDFDVIVIATGFVAVTGSYESIDIRGTGGRTLQEHWVDGPHTFLGMQAAGFPNLFLVGGPQSSAGIIPRVTETQATWVANCVAHLRDRGLSRIETTEAAEQEWHEHVLSGIEGTLQEDASGWAFGTNVGDGRQRAYLLYAGGQPQYRERIAESAEAGYKGFELS